MRSALFPLSILGGRCRSRELTVWGQRIAMSIYAKRSSRVDPANLLPTDSRSEIPLPQAWLEFDVEDVEAASKELEKQGYKLLVSGRTEPCGQVVSRLLPPRGASDRCRLHSFDAQKKEIKLTSSMCGCVLKQISSEST